MATADELSVLLPASVVEEAEAIARRMKCSTSEIIREALCRYQELDVFVKALQSGRKSEDAVDDLVMEFVNRMVHETRAEIGQERLANSGDRKAS